MMQCINAIRVMMLTYCGQNMPNTQITTVIPKSEWEKIKRIIYPRPEVTTIWRGWQKVQIILTGFKHPSYAP